MNQLDLTRRRLLQAGGVVMVSSLLPASLKAIAATTSKIATVADLPTDRISSFIAISADGMVTAYHGHVDLGTGLRTALAQIVADEVEAEFEKVDMILGDTNLTSDQGPTIASNSIQVDGIAIRQASAQLRGILTEWASKKLNLPVNQLRAELGYVFQITNPSNRISYGELAKGKDLNISIDENVKLKSPNESRYIGKSVARVDIPAKVKGELTYVHDFRLPEMLHAYVVRPPYPGADSSAPTGNALISVDENSIAHLPGIVKLVVINDFIGIVAKREEQALAAMRQLKVKWKPWAGLPDLSLDKLHATLAAHPKTDRVLRDDEGFDKALAESTTKIEADYVWPYHMHGSIGPSCAVADVTDEYAKVWTGTQNPHMLRKDLAKVMDLEPGQIHIIRMEASGCYGRNCADDVAADALLLSRAVGKPVRVQLTRDQESGWEPKGTAQLIRVRGGLDKDNNVSAYELKTSYPSNMGPNLALILTGKIPNDPYMAQMGDRTSVPLYDYPKVRVVSQDAAPIVRASWLRGVSALPNVFAHECWIDEAAYKAKADPIEYRLRTQKDPRAIALMKTAHKQANWQDGPSHRNPAPKDQEVVKGRGFAYAQYIHSAFPGYGAAWATWVCDVTVNRRTGQVKVDKVYVAQDAGLMINPAGVRHQVHGNIIQSTGRVLKEHVTFNKSGTTSLEWGSYPILRFDELPEIDVLLVENPHEHPMGVGESASVPSAAAISNAIFDAVGIRLREVPFTPQRVLRALREKETASV